MKDVAPIIISEREIKPYAEPVSNAELSLGSVYFSVTFADNEMCIPIIETFCFIGRDLENEDSGCVYFQDIDSYKRGVRYESATDKDDLVLYTCSTNDLNNVFIFEKAIDVLLRCGLTRNKLI